MKFSTFSELQARIQSYYQAGDYQAALDLATTQINEFPEQIPLLNYWRICMAARTDQKYIALNLLDELARSGFWYSEVLLRKSPSLQTLQGDPDYEQRLVLNRQLQESDQNQRFPLLVLRNERLSQGGEKPYPLLLGLHGNASNARSSLNFWQAAAQAGWLVALPQSSQAMWKDAFVWNDRDFAEQEIDKHYQSLLEHYPIDPQRIILGGISLGGELAIELALKGTLPAQGFIAFGPAGPMLEDLESWSVLADDFHDQHLRGYVIVGDNDQTILVENIELLVDILNERGVPTGYEILPDAAHDFSPPYVQSLLRGLDFIENEE